MNRRRAICLLAIAALLTACSTLGSRPPKHLDLSGQWDLNESLSDDPAAVMRQHSPRGGGGGGGRHHGGMRGAMGGSGPWLNQPGTQQQPNSQSGHRGGWQGGGGMGPRHGPNNEFMVEPAKLSVQQGDKSLKLIADGVPTDFEYGEKVVASVQGGAADRSSGWKGQSFVVEYAVKDGPKATRSYELNDGGTQLVVITEVSGGHGGSMKLRAVYEREPGLKG